MVIKFWWTLRKLQYLSIARKGNPQHWTVLVEIAVFHSLKNNILVKGQLAFLLVAQVSESVGCCQNHTEGMFLFKTRFFPSSECLQGVCERNLSRTSFSKSFSGNSGLLFNQGTLAWQTPSISVCHYVWVMNVQFPNINNLENLVHSLLDKYFFEERLESYWSLKVFISVQIGLLLLLLLLFFSQEGKIVFRTKIKTAVATQCWPTELDNGDKENTATSSVCLCRGGGFSL